jgi:hypothetical protein
VGAARGNASPCRGEQPALSVWRLCGPDVWLRQTTKHHVSKHTAGTTLSLSHTHTGVFFNWGSMNNFLQWKTMKRILSPARNRIKMHTLLLNYFAGRMSLVRFMYLYFILFLHAALCPKDFCGSSGLVLRFFLGRPRLLTPLS